MKVLKLLLLWRWGDITPAKFAYEWTREERGMKRLYRLLIALLTNTEHYTRMERGELEQWIRDDE